jgi:AmiR/NasT family two-component response regulator
MSPKPAPLDLRLLVADDEPLIVATLSEGLREHGYTVLEASSGAEAVRLCIDERPDLAILDLRMPGMSGIEAAREIAKSSHVPFIFLSAFDDAESVQQAAEEGALGYLVKPVNVHQVIPTIEAALQRASEIKRLQEKQAHLSVALTTGRETSVAVGLIMSQTGLGAEDAEAALRGYARHERRKMSEIATQIVEAADTLNRLVHAILRDHEERVLRR